MDNSSTEKRNFKRYKVTDFVVVTFANKQGRLMDISENGLAVKLLGVNLMDEDLKSLPKKYKSSLLKVGKGFFVEDLPLKFIRKEIVYSQYISIVAAEFDTPDVNQLCNIKEYISGLS